MSKAIKCGELADRYISDNILELLMFALEEMVEKFEELHKVYPKHVKFKAGLATAYRKCGEGLILIHSLDSALIYLEKSIGLLRELYADFPLNMNYKSNLAISCQKIDELKKPIS